MGRALRDRPGGIIGLWTIILAYPVAVEGELIRQGLRLRQLGSGRFTWSDLRAVLYTVTPGSPLGVALGLPWGGVEYMLANVVDLLAAANWQRGGDKRVKKPKPIKRPHEKDDKQTFGAEPIAAGKFEDWWNNG
jgi:hypothetical protein